MTATQTDIYKPAKLICVASNENALIALAKQQDQAAFRTLYQLHISRVYALCFRLTGNTTSAEEATQEVFLQVWRKLNSFMGDSSFATWLHSVATNTTLTYLRKQKSWKSRWMGQPEDNDVAIPIAETSTDLGRLDQLLPLLPERARIVFVLHAIEGYRHELIGKALSISTGTSKAHFHRARTLITQWLEEEK